MTDLREAYAGIDNVHLELSNRCGYSHMHPLCPNDASAPPCTLPLALIERVLMELSLVDYDGALLFSIYNEPLTDPRLFHILNRVRDLCPSARPYMYTNCWNLDQEMLNELARFGLTRIHLNAYTESEHRRIAELTIPRGMSVHTQRAKLDGRMEIYDAPAHGQQRPCYATQRQALVWSSGEVGLCCIDWKKTVTFGSLHDHRLSEILLSEKRVAMRDALASGDRSCVPVCAGCLRQWRAY